jgi:hypothetical protein
VKTAAIGGTVEKCHQVPGANQQAMALPRLKGPLEIEVNERRFESWASCADFVMRDVLQLEELWCGYGHGNSPAGGLLRSPSLVAA